MTMLPHRAIHLIGLGQENRVRSQNTVWLCTGCFTCATRCPNDIDIPGLFDSLRASWKPDCPAPGVLEFHASFLRDVKRRGRAHELRALAEYYLAIHDPLRDVSLGLRLFRKGRLRLLPSRRIRGFKRWAARQP